MNMRPPDRKYKLIAIWAALPAVLAVLVFVGIRSHGKSPLLKDALSNMVETTRLLSEMKVNLLKSVEAEKSAVLADTDEASEAFAGQSIQAAAAVDEARLKLRRLASEHGTSEEMKLVGEFDQCWAELQKIDQVLLGLAVRNTNIKAAKLSQTEAHEAMERFEKAFGKLIEISMRDAAGQTQIVELALRALGAGHKIEFLQLPHILASSDERMHEIEVEIKEAADQVDGSIDALDALVNEKDGAALAEAKKAYTDFMQVNARVIELSRQNTNIKSMELSLGKKRIATAQCEDSLGALQEAVNGRTFKATR
jgi:hypothetical protein